MMIPYGTPCDIDELCQIHVYRPYIDNQINRKVSGAYFFSFFFKYGGGQGALNFLKWRHDLFFNFLLNMEGPTPGGHSTLEVTGWSDRLETIPFTN